VPPAAVFDGIGFGNYALTLNRPWAGGPASWERPRPRRRGSLCRLRSTRRYPSPPSTSPEGVLQRHSIGPVEISSAGPEDGIRGQTQVDAARHTTNLLYPGVPPQPLLEVEQHRIREPIRPADHVGRGGQEIALCGITGRVREDQVGEPVFRVARRTGRKMETQAPGS
jgi:hypothetical protein